MTPSRRLKNRHAFPDGSPGGDDVLHDDHVLTGLGDVAHEHAALAVILGFLAIEEEGNVQPVPTQGDGGGHGDGNALVGGAIEDGLPLPQLFPVGAGVEFAQSRDFLDRF